MKRISVLILAVLILASSVSATSDTRYETAVDGIVGDAGKLEYESISRLDCLIAIMRVIGFDDRAAYNYSTLSTYDELPYFDVKIGDISGGYVIAADYGYNITNGVAHGYFAPYRSVTLKECLAFMLRCVEDSENVLWENIIQDSVKHGFLSPEEAETLDETQVLDEKLFRELLRRLLDEKRYLYCETTDKSTYADEIKTDVEGEMSYLEWYEICQKEDVPPKPWPLMEVDADLYNPLEVYSRPVNYVPINKLDGIAEYWFFETGIWIYKELHKDVVYLTDVRNYNFIVRYDGEYYINENKYNAIVEKIKSNDLSEMISFEDDNSWRE